MNKRLTIHISPEEKLLIEKAASILNVTVSELVRRTMMDQVKRQYSIHECADILGVSSEYIEELIEVGKLPTIGRDRVPMETVLEYKVAMKDRQRSFLDELIKTNG